MAAVLVSAATIRMHRSSCLLLSLRPTPVITVITHQWVLWVFTEQFGGSTELPGLAHTVFSPSHPCEKMEL